MNKELWREKNELTDSKPRRPRTLASPAPARGTLPAPPGPASRAPGRAPAAGIGLGGGGWDLRHRLCLFPPPPLLSTFCSIIARLLSLPVRLIRCGAASGEESGSPAASSAPAAPREKERPLPAGRSPADARTGRCALRFVPLEGTGQAGGGRGKDRSASHPPARPPPRRQEGAPEGEWGEGGGDRGVEGGELRLGRGNPFRKPPANALLL